MMRVFPLGLLLLLGACGSVDTSPGSSGVPDMPFGPATFQRGYQTTGGTIVLDRELTPNDPRRFEALTWFALMAPGRLTRAESVTDLRGEVAQWARVARLSGATSD